MRKPKRGGAVPPHALPIYDALLAAAWDEGPIAAVTLQGVEGMQPLVSAGSSTHDWIVEVAKQISGMQQRRVRVIEYVPSGRITYVEGESVETVVVERQDQRRIDSDPR